MRRSLLNVWHVVMRSAILLPVLLLGACNTGRVAYQGLTQGGQLPSELGRPLMTLSQLPYASAYLRVGAQFQAFAVLAMVSDDGVQTWYGKNGLTLQISQDQLLYTHGLPRDVAESFAGAPRRADDSVDCGDGVRVPLTAALSYVRLRDDPVYLQTTRLRARCTRAQLVTPGYSGPVLRITEDYVFPPHPQPQVRTRWLIESTRQLLRLEYAEHPFYPALELYLIKPVDAGKPRGG
ncbi:YjbF family lipoprotein [Sinimarinibacterium sp. NLF-5-8]|uniref:YjbF family lipoprotein n=1 Tax=Sinimarinibacterium sp. NLF-5-8 TaxID=2698684 RepID=UPI00137BC624|nr:YjbF family lipoprotein [Sinimarinibacterium sp. NLF-5-8]QHS10534.1 YjbF family lipoprotein [Sinimarinibacterium sp. NLF-5-8]